MKSFNVLPADTYTIFNKTIINQEDKKIISLLYQPIIGYTAVSLYYTLLDELDKQELTSKEYTHYHLMTMMQLKLEDILIAREKLEAIGLLKTYFKKDNINQYVYLLYSPISVHDFFNHPILNIVLYNNIGKREYEQVINYFKVPRVNLKDYQDITCDFDDVFSSVSKQLIDEDNEVVNRNDNKLHLKREIDFNLLIESIPDNEQNEKCFNEEIRTLINQLSYIYNLNTLDMQGLVRNSLNEKGLIDKTILRKSCRDYYQFEHGGDLPTLIYQKQPEFLRKPEGDQSKWAKMVYTFENITPYQLLKAKYKGAEPTDRDKRLIENLMIDQKLNPGVINVLISYSLKMNNEQLKKSYIETIAGQWKRLNVETVEDAMKVSEKEYKKWKKSTDNKSEKKTLPTRKKSDDENLPVWFNHKQDVTELSHEEEEELDKLLNELV